MTRTRPMLALACLCLAVPRIARAEDSQPGTLDLLKRAVEAHAKLGPATLECETQIAVDGVPFGAVIRETVKRNDAEHSFNVTKIMVGRYASSTFWYYVDGDVHVTYNPDDKEYGRSPDEHDVFQECLEAIRGGLLYPHQSEVWARSSVKSVKFEKAPVLKVTVKELGIRHREHEEPKQVTLLIDPTTWLVRQYEVGFDEDFTMTKKVKYSPRSEPFPADTFAFTAPKGARESQPAKTRLK